MFRFLKGKKKAVDTLPPPKPRDGKPIDTVQKGDKTCQHCKRLTFPNSAYYCNHPLSAEMRYRIFTINNCSSRPCLEEDWAQCPLKREG